MNRDSILTSPSFAHQGEFLASGTIWNMCPCVVDTTAMESTSSEGVPYLQNKQYLKQIEDADDASGDWVGVPVFYAYKWPTDDDYLQRNGLTNEWIVAGEGVIGLRHMPGIKIQTYVGTDYLAADGTTKIGLAAPITAWDESSFDDVTYGTPLYYSDEGQLTSNDDDCATQRAVFLEKLGSWITIELI